MDHESGAPSEWAGAGHEVSQDLSERIREVISAAEAAASAIRYEAEQYAQNRRRAAEVEAQREIADARRDAEAVLAERIRRVSDLSDTILERGEEVLTRIDRAADVKHELESLVGTLGETAARLAREARIEPVGGAAQQTEPRAEPRPRTETPPDVETVEATSVEEPESGAEAREESEPVDAEEVKPEAEPASVEAAAEPAFEVPDPDEKPKRPTFLRRVMGRETPPGEAEPGEQPQSVDDQKAPAPDGSEDQLLGARLIALQMAVAGANRGEVEQHLRRTVELQVTETVLILDDVFGVGTDTSKRVAWPSATADH